MLPVVTGEAMRTLDDETISKVGIPGAVLMETAGRALARATQRLLASDVQQSSGPVVVVCGVGNNGGDGFVAARVLRELGCDCRVFLCFEEADVAGDARVFLDAYKRLGGDLHYLRSASELKQAQDVLGTASVVLDCIFGTGLSRNVEGHFANVVAAINACQARVVAADIPSGLEADTGSALRCAVDATVTVAMGAAKIANVGSPGFSANGRLEIAEIGIAGSQIREIAEAFVVEASDVRSLIPVHNCNTHKGRRGHVLALAGGDGKRGAGRLAGMAALRVGAGLVTVAARVPDAHAADPLMSEAIADAGALRNALVGKAALLMGPGMDTEASGKELVAGMLSGCELPMVLDADALNHLSGNLGWAKMAKGSLVLTPHPGEAARLLGISSDDIQSNRLAAVRHLAAMTGATVVLKGARTCIVDGHVTGAPALICRQGGPELATAGTGDVLAGMIAGLLAQGMDAVGAAMLAVYWHGVTGRVALERLGGHGVVASDLLAALPVARSQIAASE